MTGRDRVLLGPVLGALGLVPLLAMPAAAAERNPPAPAIIEIAPTPRAAPRAPAGEADRSGRTRQGEAVVLQGGRLDPAGALASSAQLPRGTTARIQNLENGRITMVQIGDTAAPPNTLIAITAGVARSLGVQGGSARVAVAPLAVPQPDGSIRLGEGTGLAGREAAPAVSERPVD